MTREGGATLPSSDSLNSLESWETIIDELLGNAGRCLTCALEQFVAGTLTDEGAQAASTLAAAFRDLVDAWEERQLHEVDLGVAIDYAGYEAEEPEPAQRKARRR